MGVLGTRRKSLWLLPTGAAMLAGPNSQHAQGASLHTPPPFTLGLFSAETAPMSVKDRFRIARGRSATLAGDWGAFSITVSAGRARGGRPSPRRSGRRRRPLHLSGWRGSPGHFAWPPDSGGKRYSNLCERAARAPGLRWPGAARCHRQRGCSRSRAGRTIGFPSPMSTSGPGPAGRRLPARSSWSPARLERRAGSGSLSCIASKVPARIRWPGELTSRRRGCRSGIRWLSSATPGARWTGGSR